MRNHDTPRNWTPEKFVREVMRFYESAYSELDAGYVGAWIKRFHDEGGNLFALFDCLQEVFSKTFGKLPDKAKLIEAKKLLDDREYVEYDANALPPPPVQKFERLTAADQALADQSITGILEFFASKGQNLRVTVDNGAQSRQWELNTIQPSPNHEPKDPV